MLTPDYHPMTELKQQGIHVNHRKVQYPIKIKILVTSY